MADFLTGLDIAAMARENTMNALSERDYIQQAVKGILEASLLGETGYIFENKNEAVIRIVAWYLTAKGFLITDLGRSTKSLIIRW